MIIYKVIESLNCMVSVNRFDSSVVKKAEITAEGYLKAEAIVTRTGVFTYINGDGSVRKELRHPDDVFKNESLSSLKMKPITNGHPLQKIVKSDNAKDLTIGYTGEKVNLDGPAIIANLLITDQQGVKEVQSGNKQELSLGYTVDLIEEQGVYNGEAYTHRQKNINYNHLAIVERGRAGASARIHLDSMDGLLITDEDYLTTLTNNKRKKMSDDKYTIVSLDGLEYKSSPEVANAYKKTLKQIEELKVNNDSLSKEIDSIKAAKDSLTEKYEALVNVDHEAKINEAVKERVSLISKASKILGSVASKLNLDDKTSSEIIVTVVKEKCPKVNIDEASSEYVKARFDCLFEDLENAPSKSLSEANQKLTPKLDENKREADAEEARKRMMDRMKNGRDSKNKDANYNDLKKGDK